MEGLGRGLGSRLSCAGLLMDNFGASGELEELGAWGRRFWAGSPLAVNVGFRTHGHFYY